MVFDLADIFFEKKCYFEAPFRSWRPTHKSYPSGLNEEPKRNSPARVLNSTIERKSAEWENGKVSFLSTTDKEFLMFFPLFFTDFLRFFFLQGNNDY